MLQPAFDDDDYCDDDEEEEEDDDDDDDEEDDDADDNISQSIGQLDELESRGNANARVQCNQFQIVCTMLAMMLKHMMMMNMKIIMINS